MEDDEPKPILWPHAPPHYLGAAGVYMVTAGTYRKEHFFRGRKRLHHLTNSLIELAKEHGWKMQAWAVFQITTISLHRLRKMVQKIWENGSPRCIERPQP
jgi:hypothetical protein